MSEMENTPPPNEGLVNRGLREYTAGGLCRYLKTSFTAPGCDVNLSHRLVQKIGLVTSVPCIISALATQGDI